MFGLLECVRCELRLLRNSRDYEINLREACNRSNPFQSLALYGIHRLWTYLLQAAIAGNAAQIPLPVGTVMRFLIVPLLDMFFSTMLYSMLRLLATIMLSSFSHIHHLS